MTISKSIILSKAGQANTLPELYWVLSFTNSSSTYAPSAYDAFEDRSTNNILFVSSVTSASATYVKYDLLDETGVRQDVKTQYTYNSYGFYPRCITGTANGDMFISGYTTYSSPNVAFTQKITAGTATLSATSQYKYNNNSLQIRRSCLLQAGEKHIAIGSSGGKIVIDCRNTSNMTATGNAAYLDRSSSGHSLYFSDDANRIDITGDNEAYVFGSGSEASGQGGIWFGKIVAPTGTTGTPSVNWYRVYCSSHLNCNNSGSGGASTTANVIALSATYYRENYVMSVDKTSLVTNWIKTISGFDNNFSAPCGTFVLDDGSLLHMLWGYKTTPAYYFFWISADGSTILRQCKMTGGSIGNPKLLGSNAFQFNSISQQTIAKLPTDYTLFPTGTFGTLTISDTSGFSLGAGYSASIFSVSGSSTALITGVAGISNASFTENTNTLIPISV